MLCHQFENMQFQELAPIYQARPEAAPATLDPSVYHVALLVNIVIIVKDNINVNVITLIVVVGVCVTLASGVVDHLPGRLHPPRHLCLPEIQTQRRQVI